ncbi:MAG: hypothetical protein KGQ42_05025 [Alphaproteobacteria bacterium]|nr:hypothetical protein [Alphaproteobacteria bacterium]
MERGDYSWAGGSEALVRCAPQARVQIILLPPLFDEANRMRKTLTSVMRALATQGIGTLLPDLPAMGESLLPYGTATLADWQIAAAALGQILAGQEQLVLSAAFRGGALIDKALAQHPRWRLAPESGTRLLRDIKRMVSLRPDYAAGQDPYGQAGHALPPAFVAALEAATPDMAGQIRTLRLNDDRTEADARIPGTPLWRRSEPGEDAALTAALTTDLATWAKQCAAS